ncbi:MAG: DUF1018 domain-containing protein [Leptospiraceae bacterium]|nr:DUF1018 domain-containing protein [Leptospiraceae bacterium]NUM40825.1 DUF1018 domain-containing protein [Leptospiraceae bacterium]
MSLTLHKRIWALKNKAGIEEENFRLFLQSVTGKSSTKLLSELEQKNFIRAILKIHPHLKKKASKSELRTPEKYPSMGKREESLGFFAFITLDQLKYIHDLVSIINQKHLYKFTENTLPKRMYGKEASKLKRWEAVAVIEALKRISRRELKEKTENR